ncbi:flagellar basal body P-ring protein FlgI [Mucisphaera calidilacus]|uniref:Flagellar basal body P-ring protein n=1 Tax=Mucisphaera calidilacus TaxID=2527982 RepID=A0A518BZL7_9BACT|nr:flagellar basal body P-ring protein FlgI [Mucisphaera calidilacus]QDU72423.1 flagellar basal body P-ring protein [Mucisphaera calidilacus]
MTFKAVPRMPFAPALRVVVACTLLAAIAGTLLAGCGSKNRRAAPTVSSETYRGPLWLRGSVGSMATLREGEPLLVSGYTLCVNLNGTGSSEVPTFLRGFLLNEMRKRKVPQPERVLFDTNTAVVAVEGLIPAGASKGDRFDVLVTAIDRQTLSLEGGNIWSTQVIPGPPDPSLAYKRPVGEVGGDIFIDPVISDTPDAEVDPRRQALVVAGGKATEDRILELVLNQPSWQRSRLIADRINERFPKTPNDRFETARPMTDAMIRIRVPSYWRGQASIFLDHVMVLFTQRAPGFDRAKTLELADRLNRFPTDQRVVISAWRAMGRGVLPVLREIYTHDNQKVRLAALDAGAGLNDGQAARFLIDEIDDASVETRIQIAASLAQLPDNLQASIGLNRLIRDPDTRVRLAAYEAMVLAGDPAIERIPVYSDRDKIKLVIDEVPAPEPLIYVTFDRFPRIVYFGGPIDVQPGKFAQAWDGRLMLRTGDGKPMSVFYQPNLGDSITQQLYPNLTELTHFLAHNPTRDRPQQGLNLSYGQTVDAIYELVSASNLSADFRLRRSTLSELIEQQTRDAIPAPRPVTSADASDNTSQNATLPAAATTGLDNQ